MTDTMEKEWFEDEKRKWPSVEDATRRTNVLIDSMKDDGVGAAARDLIVLMRELGRVTAELKALKLQVSFDRRMREYLTACKSDALAAEPASGEALDALYKFNVATPEETKRNLIPPPQGEEERAKRESWICGNRCGCVGIPCRMAAALRRRADEATRAENEALAKYFEQFGKWYSGHEIAAAIRARIAR